MPAVRIATLSDLCPQVWFTWNASLPRYFPGWPIKTILRKLDQQQYLATVLQENKPLVMCLLEDEYLSSFFWQEPTPRQAKKSKKAMYDARTWYLEGRWTMILDRLIERIYLLRCQLMHGASTHGSKLNRVSLNRCIMMLRHLLPAIIMVITNHGADEDWGELCYPPLG